MWLLSLYQPQQIAIFVDGEFWHGHPTRCQIPQTRRSWWAAKIEGNKRRDRRQNRVLRAAGWTVVRIWQHQIKGPVARYKLRRAGLLPTLLP